MRERKKRKKKAYCLSDVPNVVATFSYLPATFSLIAPKQHSMEFLHPIPPRRVHQKNMTKPCKPFVPKSQYV